MSDQQVRKFEEWKECRSSIARFSSSIVDLRKYGFSLITGLLTADAIIFVKIPELTLGSGAAISFVMMILVLALFGIDRYQGILLRSAVKRAEEVESELGFRLTTKINIITTGSNTDESGTVLYMLFIIACIIPTLPAAVKFYLLEGVEVEYCLIGLMLLLLLVFWIIISWYHCYTKRKFKELING